MPVTEQQFDTLCDRINAIDNSLHELLHGNGLDRTGLRTLLDDMYGPARSGRLGLVARVTILETQVEALCAQRKEARWLQRGIAVGVALVLVEGAFNVNLVRAITAWLGGTP